jgi:hypothetical protein
VPVADDLEQVKRLVRSLDRQTLPAADFEVVLPAGADQLDALAAHRPNVKVVRDGEPAGGLLAAADGDFVLAVRQDETLFPGALARLRDFAEQHDVDGVAARVVVPGVPAPASLWADADRIDDRATAEGQLLVRRDAATWSADRLQQSPTARIGVLGRYAVTRRSTGPAETVADPAGSSRAAIAVEELGWQDGSLHLVLQIPGPAGADRAVLQLRHAGSEETFLVPAEVSPADSGAGLRLTAAIAPTGTPAAGQSLAAGIWHVEVVLVAAEEIAAVAVPWSPCPPALIGATAVVPVAGPAVSGTRSLTLDVGPTTQPLLSNLDPAGGTVTESVAGSELVLDLPALHVFGSDGLDGFIALAKMRLPARLRVRDGRAQLVAMVTGLAGNLALSAEFGPGPLRPTGLSLQVDGTGAMSVITTPPPAPKPPAPAPAAAPAPAPAKPPTTPRPAATKTAKRKKRRKKVEPPRTGLVADLRRAVPAPLEPVVKRLASVPAARRLYRRVTR